MLNKDRLDIVLKLVATLIAVFGVWKYFKDRSEALENAARGESLNVIREYSSTEMVDAKQALLRFWSSQPEFARYVRSVDSMSQNEYTIFVRRVLPSYKSVDEMVSAFFRMNEFFDVAYHCRSSRVCNDELLDDFMCQKVTDLDILYSPFFAILNQRVASQEFGQSLRGYKQICDGR